jgi:SAM-dependent methyltransferase
MREILKNVLSEETGIGLSFLKPHGYAGDYEIIDRIYRYHITDNPVLIKWDFYGQHHESSNAVRNRNIYFCDNVFTPLAKKFQNQKIDVLNLASGPGRDMRNFFATNPNALIYFDCIEQDQNAINYAKKLCSNYIEKVNFIQKNVLRFNTKKQYQVIWSAGLFDYFEDKVFVTMLQRLGNMLLEDGEIIIGNFSSVNPNKAYMEFLEWHLHYRSPQALKALALVAGFNTDQIGIKKEPQGINLFLHIKGKLQ